MYLNVFQVEPIWATAQNHGMKFATYLWGRCDVNFHGTKTYSPSYCENLYKKDGTKTLVTNVDKALGRFQGIDMEGKGGQGQRVPAVDAAIVSTT